MSKKRRSCGRYTPPKSSAIDHCDLCDGPIVRTSQLSVTSMHMGPEVQAIVAHRWCMDVLEEELRAAHPDVPWDHVEADTPEGFSRLLAEMFDAEAS